MSTPVDGWVISAEREGDFDIFFDRSPIFYGAGDLEEAEAIVYQNGGTLYTFWHEDGYFEEVHL